MRANSRERGRRGRGRASRSRSREERREERDESGSSSSGEEEVDVRARDIRDVLLEFFGRVKHERGFVFTKQERLKLIKEQQLSTRRGIKLPVINWKESPDWSEEEQRRQVEEALREANLPDVPP